MGERTFSRNKRGILYFELLVSVLLCLCFITAVHADVQTECIDRCLDQDRDGAYGYNRITCPSGTDLNDTNSSIHPGAKEICNNNVDDDCDGKIDCKDTDCASSPFCNISCSSYTINQTCAQASCFWLPVCSGPKINIYGLNSCLNASVQNAYAKCSKQTCGAQCENDSNCPSVLSDSLCRVNGTCSGSCSCSYASVQFCPAAGTMANGTCYFGNGVAGCMEAGCSLSQANMTCNNLCNATSGPQDTLGPAVSGLTITPQWNNGIFNISANVTDSCSQIGSAKYFLRNSSDPLSCSGNGTDIALEGGIANPAVQFAQEGSNRVCIQARDSSGNTGSCVCSIFNVDLAPPGEATNISINSFLESYEKLVCNANPILKFTICDSKSGMESAEYFLDAMPPAESGYKLSPVNHYLVDGQNCSDFSGAIDLTALDEGTHTISHIIGKDAAGNPGNISGQSMNISFIKDSLPPLTTKALDPSGKAVFCNATGINNNSLTESCFLAGNGTTILLNATDQDTQGSGQFAGNVTIYYRLFSRASINDNWSLVEENSGQELNVTLQNDYYSLIEYWAQDGCQWNETHHFELDAVEIISCGDSICTPDENGSNCPIDCPAPVIVVHGSGTHKTASGLTTSSSSSATIILPSNMTNSSGSAEYNCTPEIVCSLSNCTGGVQIKNCTDLNGCSINGTNSTLESISCQETQAIEPHQAICGDGICEEGEICPEDCLTLQPNSNSDNNVPTGRFFGNPSEALVGGFLIILLIAGVYLAYGRSNAPKPFMKAKAKEK